MADTVVVDEAYQLTYDEMRDVAKRCGGWLRASGGEHGETAEVVVDGNRYEFRGRGLIDFLYAVKENANQSLYAAVDLCDYIAASEKQPASVFVRDAIAARARDLRRQIKGKVP
jgi:hypothetical protein